MSDTAHLDLPWAGAPRRRRVRLAGRLVTASGLHCGGASDALGGAAAAAGAVAARTVVRDGRGLPYVPGSTLRGVVRATVQSLLRAVQDRPRGLYVDDAPGVSGLGAEGGAGAGLEDRLEPLAALFGGRGRPSAVRIGDALAVAGSAAAPGSAGPPVWVERREGRAVDADTGTAPDALAFDFEVVPPGVAFDFELFADDLEDWQLGLLLLAFDQLDDGFVALGGLTARGLGRVRVQWRGLLDFDPAVLLRSGGALPTTARAELTERRAEWRAALTAHAERPLPSDAAEARR